MFLILSSVLLVQAESLNIPATPGKISLPDSVDPSSLEVVLSYDCYTSTLFDLTGWKSCEGDKSGEVRAKVKPDGTFVLPKVSESERSLLTGFGWASTFQVEVSMEKDGKIIADLGTYNGEYIANPRDLDTLEQDLSDMTMVEVKGAKIPVQVEAAINNFKKRVPWDELKTHFPSSYNDYIESRADLMFKGGYLGAYQGLDSSVEDGVLTIEPTLWVIQDFIDSGKVKATLSVKPAIGLKASPEGEYKYVTARVENEVMMAAKRVMTLPQELGANLQPIVLQVGDAPALSEDETKALAAKVSDDDKRQMELGL